MSLKHYWRAGAYLGAQRSTPPGATAVPAPPYCPDDATWWTWSGAAWVPTTAGRDAARAAVDAEADRRGRVVAVNQTVQAIMLELGSEAEACAAGGVEPAFGAYPLIDRKLATGLFGASRLAVAAALLVVRAQVREFLAGLDDARLNAKQGITAATTAAAVIAARDSVVWPQPPQLP